MNNQTQLVRSAINLFIIVAIAVSLFQQLYNVSQKPQLPQTTKSPTGQQIPIPSTPTEPTGPKIQGIRIQASDKFSGPLKQILVKNNINVQIVPYQFQGNQYIMSLIANWGHMVLIFFFMSKHKAQTDPSAKTKLLVIGAIAVVGWFYFSPQLKPQRFAIQVQGSKVYQKDYLNDQQVIGVLNEYEFQIDDMNSAKNPVNNAGTQKVDAWEQRQQQIKEQGSKKVEQPMYQEQQIF